MFFALWHYWSSNEPENFLTGNKLLWGPLFGENSSCNKSEKICGGVLGYSPTGNVFGYQLSGDESLRIIQDEHKYFDNRYGTQDCRITYKFGAVNNSTEILQNFHSEDDKRDNTMYNNLPWVYKDYCHQYDFNKTTPAFFKSDYGTITEMSKTIRSDLINFSQHYNSDPKTANRQKEIVKDGYVLFKA